MTTKISEANIQDSTLATLLTSGGGGPKISAVIITDDQYTDLNDTAVALEGGYIKLLGSGFAAGVTVSIDRTPATSVTFISETELHVQVAARTAGTYIVYAINTDGGVALRVNGLTYSGLPTWVTGSSLSGDSGGAISLQLSATDATTFELQAGSTLPEGLTLSSGGLLSGTVTVESETVYNFTVVAIDAELQDSPRSFSINITVGDPLFASTTALLRGVANTFVTDASTNNFAVTAVGDTRPHNFNPFLTSWSNYFDGTGDYLTVPANAAFDITSGSTDSFICEAWVNWSTVGANMSIIDNGGLNGASFSNWTIYLNASSQISIAWGSSAAPGGNIGILPSTTVPVVGQWYHLALVKTNADWSLFINGTQAFIYNGLNTAAKSNSTALYIGFGITTGAGGAGFAGYISNVRIYKGATASAPYAATSTTITVPAAPLTAAANTSLLTCQSNRIVDKSTNAFAITRNGDVKVQSFSPFAEPVTARGSAYFDGSGDYMTVPSNAAFAFGTDDFTIEAWVYTTSGNGLIWATHEVGSSSGWYFNINAGSLQWGRYGNGSNGDIGSGALASNQWQHVAVTKSSGSIRLFVNGVTNGAITDSANNYSSIPYNFSIGADQDGNEGVYTGYISNLRVIKGTALYTDTFTPPTEPLTAVAGTSLLTLQNNTANNNHQFLDDSSNKVLLSRFGNATQGSFSPYSPSGWSVFFSSAAGQGRSIQTPATANNTSGTSGDFTLECWAMKLGNSSLMVIAMISGVTTSFCRLSSNGSAGGLASWTTAQANHNTFAPIGTWFHVAACRHNGTLYTYINGVMVSSVANTTNYTFNGGSGSSQSQIGNYNNTSSQEWIGYISNYRIVNGTALYPSGTTFTPSTAALAAVPGTILLTCQSNRIVDNSPSAATLVLSGTVKPSVQLFAPFKAQVQTPITYSGYLDGVGDGLSIDSNNIINFGTGDFTVEFWINLISSSSTTPGNIIHGGSTGNFGIYFVNNGVQIARYNQGGDLTYSGTPPLNTWSHWAFTRQGTTGRIFLNGSVVATGTVSTNYGASSFNLGSGNPVYFSNLRIVKGTAVYTDNFTPPTTPLTAVAGTSLLTCQSTTFIDNSTNNFAITTAGNSRPVELNPFGVTSVNSSGYTAAEYSGSMYFDGTGDYISSPSNVAIGTGPFTIECWIYPTALGTLRGIVVNSYWQTGNNGGYRLVLQANNTIQLLASTGTYNTFPAVITSSTALPSENQWYHIAVVRNSSNSVMIYINGAAAATAVTYASSLNLGGGQTLKVGAQIADGGVYDPFLGYISNLRILPGTAVYPSSFVPPAAPVTPVANTVVLLNGTNAAVADATTRSDLETVNGAQLSTVVSKFAGTSSMYFANNGGQYAQTTIDHPNFGFGTGDFTIEMWINPAIGSSYIFFDTRARNESRINLGMANSNSGIQVSVGSTAIITVNSGITAGSWNYVTVTRSSGGLRLFINGTQVGSTTTMTTDLGAVGSLCLGCAGDARGNGAYGYSGYIQNLRITKGIARYTSNFTPPTSEHQPR